MNACPLSTVKADGCAICDQTNPITAPAMTNPASAFSTARNSPPPPVSPACPGVAASTGRLTPSSSGCKTARPQQRLEVCHQRGTRTHPKSLIETHHLGGRVAEQSQMHLGHARMGRQHLFELFDGVPGAAYGGQRDDHGAGAGAR